jgi:hypothetical protein
MNILWLIFAHVLSDWGIQGANAWMTENKGKYWIVMLAHCIIWAGCICVALQYLNKLTWWNVPFLLAGHHLIDSWKCWVYSKKPFCQQSSAKHLYIDQVLHLFQLAVVYIW